MSVSKPRVRTEAIRRRNRRILAESNVCHICGQAGADAVDHVRPYRDRDPGNPWRLLDPDNPYNLKPAHHDVPNEDGVRCNRVKSNRDPEVRLTTSRVW